MNLSVNIGSLKLRNPVMNASGTFGLYDYKDVIDFSKLGAVVSKSVTLDPRQGNPPPRIAEVQSGILNAVGIQNDGALDFVKNKLPKMKDIDVNLIVSVSNLKVADYKKSTEILESANGIAAYEVNVSCPNLETGGTAFGMSCQETYNVVKSVKDVATRPVIVKLSPNVTDIVEIAKYAVDAGADALTVANTYIGMAVDLKTRRPKLGNITGGLSGPAIKPLTMRLVYAIKKAIDIPIIASGGIMTAEDALEYLMIGA
ncbi:MAG TPA: dihydroorotate dehydrogenase, partial [Clostridiaceae bacterium]|nr:dihydroorotate dehydrogenase [Clostridiaceae bacterium]